MSLGEVFISQAIHDVEVGQTMQWVTTPCPSVGMRLIALYAKSEGWLKISMKLESYLGLDG